MPVQDYSTTPGNNTAISGINIGEGCPAGNLNGAIRQLMADVRTFVNGVPTSSNAMPTSGGIFTGQITFSGQGGFLHHNDPTATSGRVYVQPEGTALPGNPANGDIVLSY